MLWPLGAALRRTKSLRSIHLSGNQITPRLIDYIVKRIRANGVFHENVIPFNEMPSNVRFRNKLSGIEEEEAAKPAAHLAPKDTDITSPAQGPFGTKKDSTAKLGVDISKIMSKALKELNVSEVDRRLAEAAQLQFIQK